MKRGMTILALIATLGLFTVPARADTYDDGVAALHAGEFQHAYDLWWPLALAGDCRAQYAVARLLRGISRHFDGPVRFRAWKDLVRPLQAEQHRNLIRQLTRRAAEQGHPAAQKEIAQDHFDRQTRADYWAGREWMERAANRGYPRAVRDMTYFHVARGNSAEALKWILLDESFGDWPSFFGRLSADDVTGATARMIQDAKQWVSDWRPETPLCPSDGEELR